MSMTRSTEPARSACTARLPSGSPVKPITALLARIRPMLRREAGGAEPQIAVAGRPDDGDVGGDPQGGGRNAALAGDREAPLGAAAGQGRSAGGACQLADVDGTARRHRL